MALDWISSVKIADMIKRGLRSTETQDGGFTTATLGKEYCLNIYGRNTA
jgi:hypothetical protein